MSRSASTAGWAIADTMRRDDRVRRLFADIRVWIRQIHARQPSAAFELEKW